MIGELNSLFAATVLFVGGHFLLSGRALREPLIRTLGVGGHRLAYSAVALGALAWIILAYRGAPFVPVWDPAPAFGWLVLLVMPLAFIFLVAGVTTRGATAVGGEKLKPERPQDIAPGIYRVTRHPFLWGTGLWAASHLLVNGDAASIILMVGVLILSFGGMWHIDQRRQHVMGSAWGPIAMTTSVLPGAALVSRRTTMDWRGLGWLRPVAGVLAYFVFLHAHGWLFGVSPLPF